MLRSKRIMNLTAALAMVLAGLATLAEADFCLWCDPAMSQDFLLCVSNKLLVDPRFTTASEALDDMKSSIMAASQAMKKSGESTKMQMMNGAMAGELAEMIKSHSSAGDLVSTTTYVLEIVRGCYVQITGQEHYIFMQDVGKTVNFRLNGDSSSPSDLGSEKKPVSPQYPAQALANSPVYGGQNMMAPNYVQKPQFPLTQPVSNVYIPKQMNAPSSSGVIPGNSATYPQTGFRYPTNFVRSQSEATAINLNYPSNNQNNRPFIVPSPNTQSQSTQANAASSFNSFKQNNWPNVAPVQNQWSNPGPVQNQWPNFVLGQNKLPGISPDKPNSVPIINASKNNSFAITGAGSRTNNPAIAPNQFPPQKTGSLNFAAPNSAVQNANAASSGFLFGGNSPITRQGQFSPNTNGPISNAAASYNFNDQRYQQNFVPRPLMQPGSASAAGAATFITQGQKFPSYTPQNQLVPNSNSGNGAILPPILPPAQSPSRDLSWNYPPLNNYRPSNNYFGTKNLAGGTNSGGNGLPPNNPQPNNAVPAPGGNGENPVPQSESSPNPKSTGNDSDIARAMRFAETVYVICVQNHKFKSVFNMQTPKKVAASCTQKMIRGALRDCKYFRDAEEIANSCSDAVKTLAEKCSTEEYGEAISKSFMDAFYKKGLIGINPENQAKLITTAFLARIKKRQSSEPATATETSADSVPDYPADTYDKKDYSLYSGDSDYSKAIAYSKAAYGKGGVNYYQYPNQPKASQASQTLPKPRQKSPVKPDYNPNSQNNNDQVLTTPPTDCKTTTTEIVTDETIVTTTTIAPTTTDGYVEDSNMYPDNAIAFIQNNNQPGENKFPDSSSNEDGKKYSATSLAQPDAEKAERNERVRVLMEFTLRSISNGEFNYQVYSNVISALAKYLQTTHPDWGSQKCFITILIESLVASTQLLKRIPPEILPKINVPETTDTADETMANWTTSSLKQENQQTPQPGENKSAQNVQPNIAPQIPPKQNIWSNGYQKNQGNQLPPAPNNANQEGYANSLAKSNANALNVKQENGMTNVPQSGAGVLPVPAAQEGYKGWPQENSWSNEYQSIPKQPVLPESNSSMEQQKYSNSFKDVNLNIPLPKQESWSSNNPQSGAAPLGILPPQAENKNWQLPKQESWSSNNPQSGAVPLGILPPQAENKNWQQQNNRNYEYQGSQANTFQPNLNNNRMQQGYNNMFPNTNLNAPLPKQESWIANAQQAGAFGTSSAEESKNLLQQNNLQPNLNNSRMQRGYNNMFPNTNLNAPLPKQESWITNAQQPQAGAFGTSSAEGSKNLLQQNNLNNMYQSRQGNSFPQQNNMQQAYGNSFQGLNFNAQQPEQGGLLTNVPNSGRGWQTNA